MPEPLPDRFKPFEWVAEGRSAVGELPMSALGRLSASLAAPVDEPVRVELAADSGADGRPVLSGRIRATLVMQCDRCLEPMSVNLDVPVRLALVRSEAEAARLPQELEPLLVDGEWLDVATVIEDELLLAMPMFSKHAARECAPQAAQAAAGAPRKPFAVLASLRRGDKGNEEH